MKIAAIALHLARCGEMAKAAGYVARLSGSSGLVDALTAWIDTFMAVVYPEHRRGQPIMLKFLAAETGEIGHAEDVGRSKAWAGRLISFRAADDPEGFDAVLRSVPEGAPLGDGIMALLGIVATSLNNVEMTRAAAADLRKEWGP